jgi:hypothetical protein
MALVYNHVPPDLAREQRTVRRSGFFVADDNGLLVVVAELQKLPHPLVSQRCRAYHAIQPATDCLQKVAGRDALHALADPHPVREQRARMADKEVPADFLVGEKLHGD